MLENVLEKYLDKNGEICEDLLISHEDVVWQEQLVDQSKVENQAVLVHE